MFTNLANYGAPPCISWFINHYKPHVINYWLVVDLPLWKNMSSSVGMMNFPIYGKIETIPNHQPDSYIYDKP